MKIKLLARFLVTLLFIFITACQRQATATDVSPPVQPALNPTTTSIPTNLAGYPAGNQSTPQTQASTSAPYPAPTSGASPAPTIQQPTRPPSTAICEPGPGSMTMPTMAVGISIPGNHPAAGLVFAIDFLSTKGKEQLFAPFSGVAMDLGKCQDPNTESTYTKLVDDISLKVKHGVLDDETTQRVKEIQDFADSITFAP